MYDSYFGLLETEVEDLLKYYLNNYDHKKIKDWYNGYVFGDKVIFNPWSILNFAKKPMQGLVPYWVNTGGTELIETIFANCIEEISGDIETLIKEGVIRKKINENIIFRDISRSPEALWSFLLFSGYLKTVKKEVMYDENGCDDEVFWYLKIPNKEVLYVYKTIISKWTSISLVSNEYQKMLSYLLSGDIVQFNEIFSKYVINSMSFFDPDKNDGEKVYHAFVLGLLVSLSREYLVKSNRETGFGRCDIAIIPRDPTKKGIIIEIKKTKQNETLEDGVIDAIDQIKKSKYTAELQDHGVSSIIEVGIAFSGKDVLAAKSV